jgi:hypothetical protein
MHTKQNLYLKTVNFDERHCYRMIVCEYDNSILIFDVKKKLQHHPM